MSKNRLFLFIFNFYLFNSVFAIEYSGNISATIVRDKREPQQLIFPGNVNQQRRKLNTNRRQLARAMVSAAASATAGIVNNNNNNNKRNRNKNILNNGRFAALDNNNGFNNYDNVNNAVVNTGFGINNNNPLENSFQQNIDYNSYEGVAVNNGYGNINNGFNYNNGFGAQAQFQAQAGYAQNFNNFNANGIGVGQGGPRRPGRRRFRNRNRQNQLLAGYSGFRPNDWGSGIYGEKQKRISQLKFQEYMRRIWGNENYDENSDILSPEDLNGRVIAAPGEFPHIAVIGFKKGRGPENVDWKCGGSLIDIHFVLTAAHCTDFGGEPPNWVKIGDVNLGIREDTVATQRFLIADIIRHPLYKKELYYHDIALIRLIRPAVFTRHVRPARLWASNEIPFEKVFAAGYGSTKFGKSPTKVLTFFNLTIMENNECNMKLPKTTDSPQGILDTQICAIDYEQQRDTCQGDSGGPLEFILPGRRRARYYVIGITSFGSICATAQPSVYTNVFSYLDWIENVVWPANEQQLQQQQQQLNYYNGK